MLSSHITEAFNAGASDQTKLAISKLEDERSQLQKSLSEFKGSLKAVEPKGARKPKKNNGKLGKCKESKKVKGTRNCEGGQGKQMKTTMSLQLRTPPSFTSHFLDVCTAAPSSSPTLSKKHKIKKSSKPAAIDAADVSITSAPAVSSPAVAGSAPTGIHVMAPSIVADSVYTTNPVLSFYVQSGHDGGVGVPMPTSKPHKPSPLVQQANAKAPSSAPIGDSPASSPAGSPVVPPLLMTEPPSTGTPKFYSTSQTTLSPDISPVAVPITKTPGNSNLVNTPLLDEELSTSRPSLAPLTIHPSNISNAVPANPPAGSTSIPDNTGPAASPTNSPNISATVPPSSGPLERPPTAIPSNAPAQTMKPTTRLIANDGGLPATQPTQSPELFPSASPSVHEYQKEIMASPIMVYFRGSFELAVVQDDIYATVERLLGPFLKHGIGNILSSFSLRMKFIIVDGSQIGVGRRLTDNAQTIVSSEIDLSLQLSGNNSGQLSVIDGKNASRLLVDFFGEDSVSMIVQALHDSKINITSIEVRKVASESEVSNSSSGGNGNGDGETSIALIAGIICGIVIVAALATAALQSRRIRRNKLTLEQQLAGTTDEEFGVTKEQGTICNTILSRGSASGCGDFPDILANHPSTTANPLPECDPAGNNVRKESIRIHQRSLSVNSTEQKMMDGPDLVAMFGASNVKKSAPSETESVFTTDEPNSLIADEKSKVDSQKKSWRSWNKQSAAYQQQRKNRKAKEKPQEEHFETIEIDGEMKNVYLSPIDLYE